MIPRDRLPPADRRWIGNWLNEMGLVGEGVEVGVYRGEFSEVLLDSWCGITLYLVDHWAPVPFDLRLFERKGDAANRSADYQMTARRVARFGGRAKMIRASSLRAARAFRNASLCFVYLDASHEYDDVVADISAWWAKIRPGGCLCGDDYRGGYDGVDLAVDEFCAREDIALLEPQGGTARRQWYALKPTL